MEKISTVYKVAFWCRVAVVKFLHLFIGWVGFLFFPFAYFIRHQLGIEGRKNPLWIFLNYSEDSDWGLKHYEPAPKKNFWNALLWYGRNKAFNFAKLLEPNWKSGEYDALDVVIDTLPKGTNAFDWASKDNGYFGTKLMYYRLKGLTYGRFSFASPKNKLKNLFITELQIGTGGDIYRGRIKFSKPKPEQKGKT